MVYKKIIKRDKKINIIEYKINENENEKENEKENYFGFIFIANKYNVNNKNKELFLNQTKILGKNIYLEKNIKDVNLFLKKKYKLSKFEIIDFYIKNNLNIHLIILDYSSDIFKDNTISYLDLFKNTHSYEYSLYYNIIKFNRNKNYMLNKIIFSYNDSIVVSTNIYNIYNTLIGYI